jgi:hypothetical protein
MGEIKLEVGEDKVRGKTPIFEHSSNLHLQ